MTGPTVDRTNYNALVDDTGNNTDGTNWTKNQVKITTLDPIDTVVDKIYTNSICEGRLTLTTGMPITTADVTGAATMYFTPTGKGGRIALYSGSAWAVFTLTEISLALGTLVNAQGYDVFVYDNAGTRTLELAEWANATVTMTIATPGVVTWTAHGMSTGMSITFTNSGGALPTGVTANTQYFITVVDANTFKLSTTLITLAAATFIATSGTQSGTHTGHQPQARATALVLQDGVLCKTGALTRRFVGAFMASSTTTTEESVAKRFVSNYYNRTLRELRRFEAASSWTYNTATIRQANANVANQVAVFVGFADVPLNLNLAVAGSSAGTTYAQGGIGEDSTNTIHPSCIAGAVQSAAANALAALAATLNISPTLGYHQYVWLEWAQVASLFTMWQTGWGAGSSQNSGLTGRILG